MRYFFKMLILFSIGGICYLIIELLWRGYTHRTMFLLGGACFAALGLINEFYDFEIPLVLQMIFGTLIITALEFVAGCIVNLHFHMEVWDYSALPFNLLGQICLPYMALWFILSPLCIITDDWLRYALFGEERPHYRIL